MKALPLLEMSKPVGALQLLSPGTNSKALASSMTDSLMMNEWRLDKHDSMYMAELTNRNGTLTFMGDLFSGAFVLMVNGVKKEVSLLHRLRMYFAVRNEFNRRCKQQKKELLDAHLSDAFSILQGV